MSRLFLLLMSLLLISAPTYAKDIKIVVIGHPSNVVESLSKKQLIEIYFGRSITSSDGHQFLPLDYEDNTSLKADFYHSLVNKELNEVNSYWARLLFSGRAQPPTTVDTALEGIQIVSQIPEAIAYVYSSDLKQIDHKVKIISYVD